jgi:hypothetical protein
MVFFFIVHFLKLIIPRDASLSLLDHQRTKFSLSDSVLIKTLEMTAKVFKILETIQNENLRKQSQKSETLFFDEQSTS